MNENQGPKQPESDLERLVNWLSVEGEGELTAREELEGLGVNVDQVHATIDDMIRAAKGKSMLDQARKARLSEETRVPEPQRFGSRNDIMKEIDNLAKQAEARYGRAPSFAFREGEEPEDVDFADILAKLQDLLDKEDVHEDGNA